MSKVLIIGGGAAGMMAAVAAGENGHDVWPVSYTHLVLTSLIQQCHHLHLELLSRQQK